MSTSIYIHWPFCKSKCPYCDFNSHVADNIDYENFSRAYIKQLDDFSWYLSDKKISSIFFGGGTPSLMKPKIVENIINKITKEYSVADNIEITLEANPTSVEAIKFVNFKKAGINRVSIGVQSFDDDDLKFLGREHTNKEALDAINLAAENFDNFSFDLIYARPNQTLKKWEKELEFAVKLGSKHLSLYQLTIEKGTEFYKDFKLKKFILPDEELSADLFKLTQDITSSYGFKSYEISNHAKEGYESVHNLCYWKYDDYLGIGPGAHSRIKGAALSMIYNPKNWLNEVLNNKSAIKEYKNLSLQEKIQEYLIMGLRIKEGINLKEFEQKMGKSHNELLNKNKLDILSKAKMITIDQNIRVNENAKLVLNQIIDQIIPVSIFK